LSQAPKTSLGPPHDVTLPNSVVNLKFWDEPNIFDFKGATVFGVEHRLSKTTKYASTKRQDMLENWGFRVMAFLTPAYAYDTDPQSKSE